MTPTSPPTALKRHRDEASPLPGADSWRSPPSSAPAASSSAFRNVSACNRCRLRKNRCDQRLPACASCEKANVKCVGYDPITKREIPRSYVYYLEARLGYLEGLLQHNNISFAPADTLNLDSKPGLGPNAAPTPTEDHQMSYGSGPGSVNQDDSSDGTNSKKEHEAERLNSLVSNIGMVSVQGASDPRYLGSTSGISFARVVFAAVKSSVSTASSERGGVRPSKPLATGAAAAGGGTTMRDSFFGLHSKPTIKPASFPDKELGLKLISLYFEHANPQIPILHRGEFQVMFERAYATEEKNRTPRELYMLNIVFAIGSAIILKEPEKDNQGGDEAQRSSSPVTKKRRLSMQQADPLEYYSSAIVHLESFLSSSPATDRPDGFGGGLEELQAVLLLCGFALLRPVAPGLWYIIGVAVRLAIDLGLHYEDGVGVDTGKGQDSHLRTTEDVAMDSIDGNIRGGAFKQIDAKEKGRREWVRDLRRRLWWCVYSYDRIVSVCTGRPFGVTDQVITTEFPSLLDDQYITTAGFTTPSRNAPNTSYKHVAHHYFRLRLLQSEILQVLQHQQALAARASGANQRNQYMHTQLPSPFLSKFDSFRSWRADIDRRLLEWKESAPTKRETGVQFSVEFLELNYWQALIMLYRQSLSVPPTLAADLSTTDEIHSPSTTNRESREDAESVYLKVAEAGQRVLRLYRQLHRVHLVNYTYLATHHLFMAGISFLYAIWHSVVVRSRLSLDDVDFTVLAATSVLDDLMEKCPPAESCRDAFQRMSRATVQMCMSTTGFGSQALGLQSKQPGTQLTSLSNTNNGSQSRQTSQTNSGQFNRAQPRFDMDLHDLFPPELTTNQNGNAVMANTNTSANSRDGMYASMPYSTAYPAAPIPSGMSNPIMSQSPPQISTSQQQPQPTSYLNTHPFAQPLNLGSLDGMQGVDIIDPEDAIDGVDMGFGFGGWHLGGEHDWSEDKGFDLFDGFFFGNGAGA